MKNSLLKKRAKIYENIDVSFKRKSSVLLSKKLASQDLRKIQKTVENLILISLRIYYKKKFNKKNLLEKNIEDILKLPNITPGGQIRGTSETAHAYQLVHNVLYKILKKSKLYDGLQRLGWFSIRIKKGIDTKNYQIREYATSKIHSDIWAGEKNHSKIILMLLGDVKRNSVSFFEPLKFKKGSFDFKNKSFDKGLKNITKIKKLGRAELGELCFFDQYCLHQTYLAKQAKARVSIDLRVDPKEVKLINNKKSEKKDKKFVLLDGKKWKNINYKKQKYHNKTFQEIKNLYQE